MDHVLISSVLGLLWQLTTTNPIVLCSLGATPMMELMIAAGKAVAQLQIEHGLAVERVYTGSFMTSLDMAGNITGAEDFEFLDILGRLSGTEGIPPPVYCSKPSSVAVT